MSTLSLHCPTCSEELHSFVADNEASAALHCLACSLIFPTLSGVQCLLPGGEADLALWEARAHKELQDLRHKQQSVASALEQLPKTNKGNRTQQRLQTLDAAYTGQLDCLNTLLAPLLSHRHGSDRATYSGLQSAGLTDTTTLFSYTTNLFRDWVWGEVENRQAVAMLQRVAPGALGRTLVLGAGGGRLAWDLACGAASEVYAADINPFTSLVAQALSAGDSVPLWEFPMAPIGAADVALKRDLRAGQVPSAPLVWLLADARALPFAPGSFDTVVTPWFTDVVQTAPATTAAQLNQLLRQGGRWLNFGSVAFANADPAQCLLLPELVDCVEESGFSEIVVEEQSGPYLCSPHSRYGRQELLHAFAATKERSVPDQSQSISGSLTPAWISNTNQPVPALAQFQDQALATQVHAFLMSLVDGKRSIDQIAAVLEQQQLLSAREATPLIQGFLEKMLPPDQGQQSGRTP